MHGATLTAGTSKGPTTGKSRPRAQLSASYATYTTSPASFRADNCARKVGLMFFRCPLRIVKDSFHNCETAPCRTGFSL